MPGPVGYPLVGALPAILREGIFEYVERCWREYGDFFQIPTGGRSRIIFTGLGTGEVDSWADLLPRGALRPWKPAEKKPAIQPTAALRSRAAVMRALAVPELALLPRDH